MSETLTTSSLFFGDLGYLASTSSRRILSPAAALDDVLLSNYPPNDEDIENLNHVISDIHKNIEKLNDEIDHVQNLLDSLCQQRENAQLLANRYMSLLAPMRNLPDDILEGIFMSCVSEITFSTWNTQLPWVLTQVCKRWRTVARQLGSLWTVVDISRRSQDNVEHSQAMIHSVMAQVQNSGQWPLHIRVAFRAVHRNHPILNVVLPHSARWEQLHLSLDHPSLHYLSPVRNRLVSLKSLRVHGLNLSLHRPEQWIDVFGTVSGLKNLELYNIKSSDFAPGFPWLGLTRYQHINPSFMDIYNVLFLARHIERCELDVVRGSDLVVYGPDLALPNLRHLSMKIPLYQVHRENFLIPRLTLPALESLVISCSDLPEIENLISLIMRSSCSLRKLTVMDVKCDDGDLIRLLEATPGVEELDIGMRLQDDWQPSLQMLVHSLTANDMTPCLAPRLQSFSFSGYLLCDFSGFITMIASRREIHGYGDHSNSILRQLSLSIFPPVPDILFQDDILRSRLESLKSEGLDLTIEEL